MLDLLDRLGLRDEFPLVGHARARRRARAPINFADVATDPLVAEILTPAATSLWFLAEHLDAYDFFVETQRIGLATGVIYTPGEAIADPALRRPRLPRRDRAPRARPHASPTPARRTASRARRGRPAARPLLGEHQDLL